ncbi:MAG TPA: pilus assembly protein PilP [Deltaproteobacteria bacterium]|nr:pilus assembly protein PilP [Deltaproteobacteria bacterium]HQB39836.1 pilus assembly protein PilP [Deltaproteobacteria bacterium]
MIRRLPKNKSALLLVMAAASAVLFVGCNKDEKTTAVSTQNTQTQPAKPQATVLQKPVSSTTRLAPAAVNQFDFSNKRDPFKPYIAVKAVKGAAGGVGRSALPIHSFDISQFKLIGIVLGGKDSFAQVVDPNGKAYVISIGKTIGKNEGKVVAITRTHVEITEQFRDDNGRVRKENIRLTLPRKH